MKNPPFVQKKFKIKTDYPIYHHKIHLIQLFNLIALLFLLPLAIKAFLLQDNKAAIPLFIVAFATIVNYLYLKKSKNEYLASHFLSSLFFVLMSYLVYSGGVSLTGPLWISSLPLIVFFALGLNQGFKYVFFFFILILFILYAPFDFTFTLVEKAYYPDDFKLRVILSFLLITFLSALYEYNNVTSFDTLQKLREELEENSTRDRLTNLYNRRGYEKYIENIDDPQGIILMCDMDFFKKVNDTYGHDAGDFVLQEVAKTIQSTLRQTDIAIRWGGEEFFIFLPHTSIKDGALIAEKIRMSIETLSLTYKDHSIQITLSIGMEIVSGHISLNDAISHADYAMYQAKKDGRNRTVIYHAI
ncbi:MAG: GGDEF domain-containing protein [Sulfurovum sp.]|nr:GGDEF domain-containing protein [Sulfurovum sp.]